MNPNQKIQEFRFNFKNQIKIFKVIDFNLISFLKKFFKSILKYVKAYLNLKSSHANELAQFNINVLIIYYIKD